jgi:hypothetical protein
MPRRLNIVFDDELHLYQINGLSAAIHIIETHSWPALAAMDAQELEDAVRRAEAADVTLQLSPNRVRDTAGEAGTDVHSAIEIYHSTGELPDFDDFPPEQRGFIQAFSKFVLEQDPQPEASEIIVAPSLRGGIRHH